MKIHSSSAALIVKAGYIVVSICMCVLGVLFFALPQDSLRVLGIVCGITAILYGIVRICGYIARDLYSVGFQHGLETGIILILVGVLVLLNPQNLINFLCVLTGISMLLDGLFKLRISQDSKVMGIRGWWMIFLLSLILCVTGIILAIKPTESSVLLSYMLGFAYLVGGILNLVVIIIAIKVIKQQDDSNCIYIDYEECNDGNDRKGE